MGDTHMELYVQEKLSLKGKTAITDAEQNTVFTSEKGVFFNDGKIFLYDAQGKKIATILEYNGLLNKGFVIKLGKKKVAKLKKKLSLVNQKFKVKKLGWDISGNFLSKEYHITNNGEKIADITKKSLVSLLEAYSVDIANPDDAAVVVCIVLILNKILNKKKGNLLKKAVK